MNNTINIHGQFTDFIDYNNLIKAQASTVCYYPMNRNNSSMKKVVSSKKKYKRNKKSKRKTRIRK